MACARLGPESTISAVDAKRLRGGCLGDVVVRSRNRTRTYNLPVNSRLLCQLSYAGSMLVARPSAGESFWGLATTNLSASRGVLRHSVSGAGRGMDRRRFGADRWARWRKRARVPG